MPTTLLKTKLYTPPLRAELVPRPRLIERLNKGLVAGRKLTLVCAAAGSGKTTLVAAWLRQTDQPFTWLSLDTADNDLVRFLSYLIAALQVIEHSAGKEVLSALEAPRITVAPPEMEALLTHVVNEIVAIPHHFSLVLDDYHLIEASAVHTAVSFLLTHLPPQLHLVIGTRSDPPLPVARLRARGLLTELRASDLRFSSVEATTLLNKKMGLDLSSAQIAALERRTEGWIAGLHLAGLSLQGRDDVTEFVAGFAGSHRYILDYLTAEVLNRQSQDVRDFLLRTAVLDRLSGALCNRVTGRSNSQGLLESLVTANLFLIPLDDEQEWYRYHQLFTELLRHRLHKEQPDLELELHRRASQWFEDNGSIPEAVTHALASGDVERAASLIEWTAWAMVTRGELVTLLGWLEMMPDELVISRPQLAILRAWALALTGDADGAEACLEQVDPRRMPGDVAAVRAYVASQHEELSQAVQLCHEAFEHLPEEKWFSRGIAAVILGMAPLRSGDPMAASRALNEAIRLNRAAGQDYLTLIATTMLGEAWMMQGRLHLAAESQRQALRLATERGSRPAPFAGAAHIGLAAVLYEWNDLEGALHHATAGVRLSKRGRLVDTVRGGYIILAQVHRARGHTAKALEIAREEERLALTYEHHAVSALAAPLRATLQLWDQSRAAMSGWLRQLVVGLDSQSGYGHELEQLCLAGALVANASSASQARETEAGEALRLLAPLLDAAKASGRNGSVIKIIALQALAFQALGEQEVACFRLKEALSMAEREGYVRTFVDEGEPMARLLRRALCQGIAPNYVARLLAACSEEVALTVPATEPLIEPLTERELDVLRLVVAGLSNAEIAEELVIAVSTVKSHINHIYGKLGVKNRAEAVAQVLAGGLL